MELSHVVAAKLSRACSAEMFSKVVKATMGKVQLRSSIFCMHEKKKREKQIHFCSRHSFNNKNNNNNKLIKVLTNVEKNCFLSVITLTYQVRTKSINE